MEIILKSGADACLFFWAEQPKQYFCIETAGEIVLSYENEMISVNADVPVCKKGISCLRLINKAEETKISFLCSHGIVPFIVPGPGIMPRDRIDKQNLWFPADFDGSFYIYAPEEMASVCFGAYGTGETKNTFRLSLEGEDTAKGMWMPAKEKHAPWQICEGSGSGWWSVKKTDGHQPFRISEWNGLAVFFKMPETSVPYSYLIPENNQKLDYRVSVMRNGHIESAQDILYHEKIEIPFIAGTVDIVCSAGFCYEEKETAIQAEEGKAYPLDVKFEKAISVPAGWLRGDCHVHSVYEDACCFPERITKSGRCNGLDYMFLTDHGGKLVMDNGLNTHREQGRFLPLPGQECVNVRTHMNFLNVDFDIDYKEKTEDEWIKDAEQKATKPYAVMLNHPSHLSHVMHTPWGAYFRSWWVATAHKEVTLVENFDFVTWFDHLNRGRNLVGLWTSDTHDGTWQRPGDACAFVFTGGRTDEESIMEALQTGRVTNTLLPGAFLNLTLNGKMIGETTENSGEPMIAEISCSSNVPMERIELVASGNVIKSWDIAGEKEWKTSYEFSLPIQNKLKKRWIMAIMYVQDGDFRRDIDSQMESDNVRAYTNPIYIVS